MQIPGDNVNIHYIAINSLNNGSSFTVLESYQNKIKC